MSWKQEFIHFSIKRKALIFGEFKLKSGRFSPYFFNSGSFYTGHDICKLGYFYARVMVESKIKLSTLYGLAYKGIPIVTATIFSLYKYYNINLSFCFNRKKTKEYGEGGNLIGYNYEKNIIMIDDVITAGVAIRDSIKSIKKNTTKLNISTIVVALDRQELGCNNISAVQELEKENNCKIISIINIQDLIQYLSDKKDMKTNLEKLHKYRINYGI
ncbi:orotate phosphoribosyltransferase [Buchnera aphidicola (Formosaphis micheliae)]|uniref:orotate phosphoribosyltransferase n=1 Tax=Buchnera aphidicola TaxID=9 RepID=UPI0031B84F2F